MEICRVQHFSLWFWFGNHMSVQSGMWNWRYPLTTIAWEGLREKVVLKVGLSDPFKINKNDSCSQKEVASWYFPPKVKISFCQVVAKMKTSLNRLRYSNFLTTWNTNLGESDFWRYFSWNNSYIFLQNILNTGWKWFYSNGKFPLNFVHQNLNIWIQFHVQNSYIYITYDCKFTMLIITHTQI